MRVRGVGLGLWGVFLAVAPFAGAQVSPNDAVRAMETEAASGGAEDEVDAAAAQAEVPSGEAVPGLSPKSRGAWRRS